MFTSRKPPVVSLALILGMGATAVQAEEVMGTIILEAEEEGTVFGYDGAIGPEFWGDLDPNWATCKLGQQQSPINLNVEDAKAKNIRDLKFNYQETSINILNNGHTVQVNYDPGSYMEFAGTRYELLQFHFHSPSEHTFQGGAQFEAEMHLVHRSGAGRLAVVAVMINQADENEEDRDVRRLDQMLPRSEGVKYFLDSRINVADLLPDDRRPFVYRGSLTTPPCSEGVRWFVLKEPIELSRQQVETLNEVLDNLEFASNAGTNNRPAQALNNRQVRLDIR